ncbi:thiol reductant ABC exporter subunit CydC [Actinoplanes sp. KI2]|uniref:thiol reductant ABC exporter subunit CydC n=1 Tax=Actinoplanes sp. KI2 TaxID=2983315 RepID=UPI0021D5BBF7|nr:thiol reductant ABC exporter subunit CydC [Actinoplanes sp. KI2]MCU7731143.1 thiol reductant ABC exporter subunit CydC [Actinoplanes sp. KI2]
MRARFLAAVLAGAGAAGAAIGLMATSAFLISRAALHPPVLHLMVAIVAVRAFGIGRGVLRYAERLTGHDAALRALGRTRVRIFTHLAKVAPAGLAGFRRADLAKRLADDVDAVLDLLTRVVLPYTVALVAGAGSVLLIGSLSVPAGLTLALGILLVGAGIPALQSRAARQADGRLAPLRGSLATGTADLAHGLPDLIAYGAVDARLAALAATGAELRRAERRSSVTAGLAAAATAVATGLSLLVGLAAGAVAVGGGVLRGELLAVVVLTPLAVFETVGALPAAAQRYAACRASVRRLREVLAAPSPVTVPDPPARMPAGPYTLRLERVSAEWLPGRTALRDVSLTLAPGDRVALTGPSGSGKSTAAAVLVRFLDPAAGRATLNGVDLRTLDPAEVRDVVGYLPEDAYLFDTTIAANLRIGRPAAGNDELRAALASARLADWVETLPDGLETAVGEHGMALSGGQRRRLALARALLRDFRILILDEPTEHLDDETAAALTEDLLAAAGDRAVLLITHRPGIAALVDRVVSLDAPGVSRDAPLGAPREAPGVSRGAPSDAGPQRRAAATAARTLSALTGTPTGSG